jgi:hypothetical protein
MFDNYDILYNTFVFNGQIQVYADPGPFYRTDQGVIAHRACKRNAIPMTEHPDRLSRTRVCILCVQSIQSGCPLLLLHTKQMCIQSTIF